MRRINKEIIYFLLPCLATVAKNSFGVPQFRVFFNYR